MYARVCKHLGEACDQIKLNEKSKEEVLSCLDGVRIALFKPEDTE
jgi:hypothetical protein